MKAFYVLASFSLLSALPAFAGPRCRVDLVNDTNNIVKRLVGEGYTVADACDEAWQMCQEALWDQQAAYPYRDFQCVERDIRPDYPSGRMLEVRCSSHDFQYQRCPVRGGRIADVQLLWQDSNARCREGRTFGAGRGHIWVDQGCRGTFRVWLEGGYGGPIEPL